MILAFVMILAVATHHAGEEHAMSSDQDQGRIHQPYIVGGLDRVHGQDLRGAGVRAPGVRAP